MMSEPKELGLRRIRRALISVSDKSGIVDFARELARLDVEIISTGGTARTLRDSGLTVRDVSNVTGFPEMMDGRVKTLHPKIHGALLAVREKPEHGAAIKEQNIEPIDLVVVNLYPFERTVAQSDVTLDEAIEQIDIGGPAMIRSAAKNWSWVTIVTTSLVYRQIAEELRRYNGSITLDTRARLARLAFHRTSVYDAAVFRYLAAAHKPKSIEQISFNTEVSDEVGCDFWVEEGLRKTLPDQLELVLSKSSDLRYGENPHQVSALYETAELGGITHAEILSGKEMSFNNYVDADAAWQLVSDFDEPGCAIIKHTNPAGVGIAATPAEAYRKALATDPVSAFGGIVAFNRTVDESAARALIEIFTEVVVAPDYEPPAIDILRTKRNLRVLRAALITTGDRLEYKQISGGMLVQTADIHKLKGEDLKVVSHRQPSDEEIRALLFAWAVCKHTKSNAIVYAREGQTVGVGAGQMSRIDSVKIGAMRAQLPIKGSVLASDAFFPFRDGIDAAAKHGITAVIQPGGSVRDEEVIAAANEHGLAMVFTGIRHFKH